MIETNIYKCHLVGPDYLIATNSCKKLEKILEAIEVMKKDPCHYICEKIGELKRELEQKREELKCRIDEEAESLMKEINSYEIECKRNLKEKEVLIIGDELEASSKESKDKLKMFLNDLKSMESNESKWKSKLIFFKMLINN